MKNRGLEEFKGLIKDSNNSTDLKARDWKLYTIILRRKLQQPPLALSKALKNIVDLDGLRKTHIRDGAAVVNYLVWHDRQMQEIYGAAGYSPFRVVEQ